MLKIDRQTIIQQELAKNGSVLIPALSEMLHCSEETIRRDLRELEASGRLTRTHGGAYLMEKYDKSYPTKLRKVYYQDIKVRMAKQAMQYIRDNDVLMLDSSTTCLELARLLVESKYNVTVISNSLLICDLCSEQLSSVNLVCLGGTFRRRTSSFTGYHTTDILSGYHADKAFISCPKITPEQGLSDNQLEESKIREAMLTHAQERILLMDHTKFGPSANVLFGSLDLVDLIITDEPVSAQWEAVKAKSHLRILTGMAASAWRQIRQKAPVRPPAPAGSRYTPAVWPQIYARTPLGTLPRGVFVRAPRRPGLRGSPPWPS